jgi:hypothetical protein
MAVCLRAEDYGAAAERAESEPALSGWMPVADLFPQQQ